jgi:hypothetical protein
MAAWEDPDPAELLTLVSDADWTALVGRYPSVNLRPLQRCLDVARACGAVTVVIETRYIDLDYRSEYSAFYSRTFGNIADSSHRLHFFKGALKSEQLWKLPQDHGYLGYVVVRPSELGRVGRAVLEPPPGIREAVRTHVIDVVNFFGQNLEVQGTPFVQQDTQLGRCAHAAAWVCHYSAFRRSDVARRSMGEFGLSVEPGLGFGRPLPSEGLTYQQLLSPNTRNSSFRQASTASGVSHPPIGCPGPRQIQRRRLVSQTPIQAIGTHGSSGFAVAT